MLSMAGNLINGIQPLSKEFAPSPMLGEGVRLFESPLRTPEGGGMSLTQDLSTPFIDSGFILVSSNLHSI
jgi:hypothetical protein